MPTHRQTNTPTHLHTYTPAPLHTYKPASISAQYAAFTMMFLADAHRRYYLLIQLTQKLQDLIVPLCAGTAAKRAYSVEHAAGLAHGFELRV
jgi:hypothetical protein